MKLSGLGFLLPGNLVSYFSSLTVNKSFRAIVRWLSTSFVQLHSILVLPSNLTLKLKTVMHEILIEWMTVVDFIFPSLHKCFKSVKWLITLMTHQPNVRLYHVKTGTVGYVLTCVSIGASMVSVANVEVNIRHERKSHASSLGRA